MAASVLKNISGTPGSRKVSKTTSIAFSNADLIRAKEIIQKELFTAERLVSCVGVSKTKEGKKKKQPTFLCVTVTSDKPVVCKLHTVKKAERGDGYKKKTSWELSDLKSVDGHCEEGGEIGAVADFELVLDKVYKWKTEIPTEKQDLLQILWKLSRRYLTKQPQFENVGNVISEVSLPSSSAGGVKADEDTSFDPLSDLAYQSLGLYTTYTKAVISSKEENDIRQLIADSEFAINDAHKFADKLANDLSMLDGANVHSIVSSEDHVLQLMQLIDEAIKEVIVIEDKLDSYDHVIMGVKEEMERMRDKDGLIKVQEANIDKLDAELSKFIDSLDLADEYRQALSVPDFMSERGVRCCTEAALALQKCMDTSSLDPAMFKMDAFMNQTKEFKRLAEGFADALRYHLGNLFTHKVTLSTKANHLAGSLRSGELRMQKHHQHHQELLPYTGLLLWMKKMDSTNFRHVQGHYSRDMHTIYAKEIGDFLEAVKLRVGQKESKHHGSLSIKHSIGSSESLQSLDPRMLSADKQARQAFNKLVEKTFGELSPICMAEQEFCVKFFHIEQEAAAGDEKEKTGGAETRTLLTEIFESLDRTLGNFIAHCVKQDMFYSLSLLVHLSHHTKVAGSAGSGSFLSKVYFSALVSVKRNFDEYIKQFCRSFEEAKPSKKSRCGIISFVHTFEEFAEQSEHIFHNSDRRSDLDKAYKVVAQCLFKDVARIASEHMKTPTHVVMFENFHRIHAVLSRLKITCLETEKKDAKVRYQEHMKAYVLEQLGRPMERLTLFFEGVDEKLKSGVKAEEVGYLLAFNKQELRKVIKEYPAKEVRKGLETLYKRIEKHMCEEENLLQVVWTSVQKEFLNQYNSFVEMLAKCYAASSITLEFSIDDVLQMFSDIAQMH